MTSAASAHNNEEDAQHACQDQDHGQLLPKPKSNKPNVKPNEPNLKPKPCQRMAGVWKRLFEDDPLGSPDEDIDRSTLVLWTQTPCGIYVDIRLPDGSPGRQQQEQDYNNNNDNHHRKQQHNAAALQARGRDVNNDYNWSDEETTLILNHKSFAGKMEYSLGCDNNGGTALKEDKVLANLAKKHPASLCTCIWNRHIDYQPPPSDGGLDVGVCCNSLSSQNQDVIRETGHDGSYAEGWIRQDWTTSPNGPFVALELVSENGVERTGYWVRAGSQFAYAIGRPTSEQHATDLQCARESSHIQQQTGKSLEEALMAVLAPFNGKNGSSSTMDNENCTHQQNEMNMNLVHTYVACHGEIGNEAEIGNRHAADDQTWRIQCSTHPGLVGCILVTANIPIWDDDLSSRCCSTLKKKKGKKTSTTTTSTTTTNKSKSQDLLQVGDLVEQHLSGTVSVSGNGGELFVRTWRIVELSQQDALPFATLRS
jgi:hypothetical protein